jgi:hypothetical protein
MRRIQLCACAVIVGLSFTASTAHGQQMHRNDLGVHTQFFAGPKNVRCEEIEHRITTEYAFKGTESETLTLDTEAAPNSQTPFIHYCYSCPRAPVSGEFSASIWVKSKKKGVQARVRLVLPHMPNPQKPGEFLFVYLDGDVYENIDNWQRLEFHDLPKLLKDKQQSLRLELNHDVDMADAYADQLILNLYTGPGRNQVWLDEIEIGPVPQDRPPAPDSRDRTLPEAATFPARPAHGGLVEISGNQLLVDGKRFFPRIIRRTDTPLEPLKRALFNTIVLEPNVAPEVVDEAVRRGFYLVPSLTIPDLDRAASAMNVSLPGGETDWLGPSASRLLNNDRVLFWYLGGSRSFEQVEKVARTASLLREADAQRPIGADVWDGLWPYSRNVDLISVHRDPLLTSLELTKYRDWLGQRKALARPGTFTWTWVQTHLPEWYTRLVHDRSPAATFDEPIGPLPEQIRLLTYISIAQGCRGVGFWSDRFLADSHQGRDRLLEVALLNLELQMLEPVLLSVNRQPVWIDTANPQVKAAVLYGDRGILVLPMWLGGGMQFVPPQAAQNNLTLTVPMIPPTAQAWEVSPADLHALQMKRVPGGAQITIPEFDLCTAVVFTSDLSPKGLLVYWQDLSRKLAPVAARYLCDMEEIEHHKALKTHQALTHVAPPVAGLEKLLVSIDRREELTRAFLNNQDYRSAYLEAQRAQRSVRHLMRLEWDSAVAQAGTPTASPNTLCYYTLPKFWADQDAVKHSAPGNNLLDSGGFEGAPDSHWSVRQTTLDNVVLASRFSTDKPHEGRQFLELTVAPKPDPNDPGRVPRSPDALERTFLSVNSPVVHVAPGTLVRISGWIRVPQAITASADGALFYDNIGGEPLAIRLTEKVEWKQFTVYRKAPTSGDVFVTLAITGLGSVHFDDIRIEPMLPNTLTPTVLKP